jgi:hypothetical protein
LNNRNIAKQLSIPQTNSLPTDSFVSEISEKNIKNDAIDRIAKKIYLNILTS